MDKIIFTLLRSKIFLSQPMYAWINVSPQLTHIIKCELFVSKIKLRYEDLAKISLFTIYSCTPDMDISDFALG